MRIDVHAHYFPREYVEKMISLGREDLHPRMGQDRDLSARIEEMDRASCEVQILSAVGPDCQMHSEESAVQAAHFINDRYAEVVQDHDGRFRAFGWLPLPYVDAALAEAGRCLDDLGFEGIAMSCGFQGRTLDDPEFEPLWDELDRRSAIVYVHPVGNHSCGHFGLNDYNLTLAYGSQIQLPMTATRLVFSGVAQRHRNIEFIFAVCGGVLPFLLPRVERNLKRGFNDEAVRAVGPSMMSYVKDLPISPDDPLAEFRRFYYDTSVQDVPLALLAAKQMFGVDRLVLGSDMIFASLVEAVEMIEQSPYLSEPEKLAILDVNAETLLARHGSKLVVG
jgi:predicted TIM-barrel fold metal-dependent hydrolase